MLEIKISPDWRVAHPGATVGFLVMKDVTNPGHHPILERHITETEDHLRSVYAGYNRPRLKRMPNLQAYDAYYRRFRKSYHILLQLESVVFRKKPIPRLAGLVTAMFLAELQDHLLTAGHDLDLIHPPLTLGSATGDERYLRLNGEEGELKAGDMYIADDIGVLSSILYGPDRRTRLTAQTRRALFTTYAPPGIKESAVRKHLERIADHIRIFSPQSRIELLELFIAP